MSELLKLAERCEAATGPDRELDFAIAEAIKLTTQNEFLDTVYAVGPFKHAAPEWTSSLDAAMTLVPLTHYWSAGTIAQDGYEHYDDMDFGWAQVVHRERGNHIDCESAATPALALCAACLRAREEDRG